MSVMRGMKYGAAMVTPLWLVLAAAFLLASCGGGERPEPEIRTVEVKVAVPVPCPALAQLGPEPEYADNDKALAATDTVGGLAKLYVIGKVQRTQRLAEYIAASAACNF